MTITELNQAIMFGVFTNDQLDSIVMAAKFSRAKLGKQKKYAFSPGDTVRFAKRWAEGYTRNGEMGGYGVIEVAYFTDDGEYRTVWTQYAEENEPDDYGRSWYDTSAELA